MRKRYRPKKEDILKGTGYDSLLEKTLHETVLKDARFHEKSDRIGYTVSHTYEPDFVYESNGKTFLIETKGRFTDNSEARKYLFIREVLDSDTELVFVWQKSGTKFPFAKRRKDGTYQTQEEWATKNGFRHWVSDSFTIDLL
ncbi:putative endonuclease [Aeromonas phage LAh_9]|uniref:Putative endonuclease n=4 Tax=Lahexavirus TaxID=2843411 RepID=A0A514A0X3_9CAUD|nr:endonuclease [Aeromonas phage 4_4572]YP_009847201.1 endonuclease [Aeromonas phage LAh_6]YP_009847424.1 endonuclease [Aeromonas phage LAh_8]YP_009847617.1 endonuclease [Aeromonas phage LAh_9]QDH46548.1 putative endonuclease [Aeromonas phage LAh_6]QDH46785.1 putative endonuclease [Aeromonas phage LAh_8]QDH46928.1 putative endonuclease [Aeromonas phage LAh_9]QEG09061.1 putative endonuclease [Aeromonas phage 4_4572]